jgi:hypothetical protein
LVICNHQVAGSSPAAGTSNTQAQPLPAGLFICA